MDGVDEAQTPAWARLAEFRVLLDLTAERSVRPPARFCGAAGRNGEVLRAPRRLATEPEPPCQEQPPADLWGDQTPTQAPLPLCRVTRLSRERAEEV